MNTELLEALTILEKEKDISKEVLLDAIEESLIKACENHFGKADNIRVTMDRETCDYQLIQEKTVVEDVEDKVEQISLEDAKAIDSKYEAGDIVQIPIESKSFGRIATQNAKNQILQKIREEERAIIYDQYSEKEKDIVTGIVQRYVGRNVSINLGKADAMLTENEQVKGEVFQPTERIKLYVVEVKKTTKGPKILVSRTHPELVKRLFEAEVTEVRDGIVEIKSIAREAGSRTKIAVWSNDPDVDPVGACVGMNGARVNAIVNELRGEKIDIVNWSDNPGILIENALSPAKVISVMADPDDKTASVIDFVSMVSSIKVSSYGNLERLTFLPDFLSKYTVFSRRMPKSPLFCVSIDRIVAYRWDLAQKAGITKEPENWEEFQEMILAVIAADPEHRGIQGMTTGNYGLLTGLLLPYASSIAACNANDFYWKKDQDNIYKPVYFADDMTCAFQLGRDMYLSGVIEKDVVQQTENSAREKFLRGENAAILYSGGFGNVYEKVGKDWSKYHDSDFNESVKALGLMPDVNGNKAYPVWGYTWSESYISAKAGTEKLHKILQIYDYLLSDEGAFFASYGPEGEFYEVVDGKAVLYEPDADITERYPSCEVLSILVRWDPSLYDERFPSKNPDECFQVNYELMKEASQVPIPEYDSGCRYIMKEERIDFSLHLNEDFLNIITGTEPVDVMWEEIQKGYEENGLQDMIDLVNDRRRQMSE